MKSLIAVFLIMMMLMGFTSNAYTDETEVASEPSPPSREMTIDEQRMFQDILRSVLQDPNNLTPEVHQQFWDLLDNIGISTQDQMDYLKDLMAGPALIYMKYFYEDALLSYDRGTPYKSKQREDYEQKLKSTGVVSDFRFEENDRLMAKIAYQEEVQIGDQVVIMDEAVLEQALANVNLGVDTVNKLFTRP
jgi:hypothetical protein